MHFSQCGDIFDIHMATFEDSGKCKGFAWITFSSEEASASAVRGFILKTEEPDSEPEPESEKKQKPVAAEFDEEMLKFDAEAQYIVRQRHKQQARKAKREAKNKLPKPRKWYVNRLQGRELRCEFAEDASTRYKKRFGKEGERKIEGRASPSYEPQPLGEPDATVGAADPRTPHERRREARKAKKEGNLVDARSIKPGAALANAPRANGAITSAKGMKITFD